MGFFFFQPKYVRHFQTRGSYGTFTVTALIFLFNEIFHIPTEFIYF